MASFWNVLGRIGGSIVNAAVPGSPLPGIGGLWGGGGGAGSIISGAVSRAAGNVLAPESSLGAAEILVPDVVERAIGTMPSCPDVGSVLAQPVARTVYRSPHPAYVVVECPRGSGNRVAMLKTVARFYGLWRPRKKPPISVRDWSALTRANRTVKKLDRVVKMSNRVTGGRRFVKSAGGGRGVAPAMRRTRSRTKC